MGLGGQRSVAGWCVDRFNPAKQDTQAESLIRQKIFGPKHFACALLFSRFKPSGMTLLEYLKRPGAMNRAEICDGLGITPGRLSQLKAAPWPPELALKMEKLTRGALSASDLCPVIKQARNVA